MGISEILGLQDQKLDAQRDRLVRVLADGLWHTTNLTRFGAILEAGAILPEPDIPDSQRWETSRGPDYYPYVRTIAGVSLFDFNQFDSKRYAQSHPISTWRRFVPYREDWGQAVWIEIDRAQVAASLISTSDLLARWKTQHAFRHLIMPLIEAAHIGPLPRTAFKRALLVQKGKTRVRKLTLP